MKVSMVVAVLGVGMLLLSAVPWPGPAESIAGGNPAPTAGGLQAPAERGKALFRDKGCVACHTNRRVGFEQGILSNAPNLSRYKNDPAFLRRWLANPAAVRPGTQMPNLQLSPDEIEDLIAFLNESP